MRTEEDWGQFVGAVSTSQENVPDLVDAYFETVLFGPADEQVPSGLVFVGERLSIAAASFATDPRHRRDALAKTLGVDL